MPRLGPTRREFLTWSFRSLLGAWAISHLKSTPQLWAQPQDIPTRKLGKTGVSVSIVGLGGEGILRTWGRQKEAASIITRALDLGITYCDTAPAYSASQDYYGALLRERRAQIFLASKTHERTREGSLRLLDESLKRLKTDHLDLWQLHDLRDPEELEIIFGPKGAIHALEEAKQSGRVHFVGVTGHTNPQVLIQAIERYSFDTLLVALNAADRVRQSFIDTVLPVAQSQGLGVIGMKVLARGLLLEPQGSLTTREALHYVLNLPVSTAIIGFDTVEEIEEVVRLAKTFNALAPEEVAKIEQKARPFAEQACSYKG